MECEVGACKASKIVVGGGSGETTMFSVAMKQAITWRELYVHRLAQREADVQRDHSHCL